MKRPFAHKFKSKPRCHTYDTTTMSSASMSRRLEAVDRRRQMMKQHPSPSSSTLKTPETPVTPPTTNENSDPTSAPSNANPLSPPSANSTMSLVSMSRQREAVSRRRQMMKEHSSSSLSTHKTPETPVMPPTMNEKSDPMSAPSNVNPLSPRNLNSTMSSASISHRRDAVSRRRQMMKEHSSPSLSTHKTPETPAMPSTMNDKSHPTSTSWKVNPLSPRNANSTTPSLNKIRQEILQSCSKTSTNEKPAKPIKSPTSSIRRRERLARHSHLLGNRGKTYAYTPKQPNNDSLSAYTPLPLKTPVSPSLTEASEKSETASVKSTVARRSLDRRARGAKKLFILATSSPKKESVGKKNMTPLEIHLTAHEEPTINVPLHSPTSSRTITTATSTLTTYSRDWKSSSHTTGSSFDDKNTNCIFMVDPNPSRATPNGNHVSSRYNATPVRSNVSPAGLSSSTPPVTNSPSDSVTSASSKRSASVQKARKALARAKPRLDSSTPKPSSDQSTPPLFLGRETVLAQALELSKSPKTRRNLDKRSARLKYCQVFSSGIAQYQATKTCPKHHVGENIHRRGARNGISVFIRKRPIFDFEVERGDFDVVFTEGRDDHDAVVVHSCNMHADMRKLLVKPTAFPCSSAFDETCTNDMLYMHVGKPMVKLASNGGLATMLTFGQTGSGKTHTITGMEERVAHDLFRMVSLQSQQVTIQFIELDGKHCNDLLGERNVKIVEQHDGSVELLKALSMEVRSAEELYETILLGKRRRATEATDKNGASSRSHAVCQITIAYKKNKKIRGALTLIDCAGSERQYDSLYHSRERQKESTEINSSLWALKECIRARADGKHQQTIIPYRSSNLTRILRESLERKDAQLCVIATIAPNATDTEHTIETLKTATTLAAMDNAIEEMEAHEVVAISPKNDHDMLAPKQWDRSRLVEWMGRKRFLEKDVPDHMDGKQIMRMSRIQLKNAFFQDDNGEKAERLFNFLRAETDKATRVQLERRIALSRAGTVSEK